MVEGNEPPITDDDRLAISYLVFNALEVAAQPWVDQEPVATLFERVFDVYGEGGLLCASGALALTWQHVMRRIAPNHEMGGDPEQPPFVVVAPDGGVLSDPDSSGVPQVDAAVWAIRFAHAYGREDIDMAVSIYGAAIENCQGDGGRFSVYLEALFALAVEAEAELVRRTFKLSDVIKLWGEPPATS